MVKDGMRVEIDPVGEVEGAAFINVRRDRRPIDMVSVFECRLGDMDTRGVKGVVDFMVSPRNCPDDEKFVVDCLARDRVDVEVVEEAAFMA